jgi:hypothetical protein
MGLSASDWHCSGTGTVFLDRVLVAMGDSSFFHSGAKGPTIIREILSGLRGDSLPLGLGTLGGDTLGDSQGEGIGKAMLGIDSFGIALSTPKFSDILDNFSSRTLGSTAWSTLLGCCARLMSSWPLQLRKTLRNSAIACSCVSQATVGASFKSPVRFCIPWRTRYSEVRVGWVRYWWRNTTVSEICSAFVAFATTHWHL